MKGLKGLTYEKRLGALKTHFLENKRQRNDLALTHRMLCEKKNWKPRDNSNSLAGQGIEKSVCVQII